MSKKSVVFFPDQVLEHMKAVKSKLAATYNCFQSQNPDEYAQSFNQAGKFVLLFSNAQEAVLFLDSKSSDLSGLNYKAFAFLNTNAKFKPESQKILDKFKINVFRLNEAELLISQIANYFSGGDEVPGLDDLAFNTPKD